MRPYVLVGAILAGLATAYPGSVMDKHAWKPAGPDDSRAPCPVLNSLANHDFIHHNGKNITFAHLNDTLGQILGVDVAIRNLILPSVIEELGDTFDLHEVALHGDFEHDASLVHDDVAPGQRYAPVTVNQTKVAFLKTYSSDGKIFKAHDIAVARVSIESAYETLPQSAVTAGVGEPALLTNVFGYKQDGSWAISVNAFLTLLGEERLPEGFERHAVSLGDFTGLSAEITEEMNSIKR